MADVTVVTPWYPTRDAPHGGAFVATQVRALLAAGVNVDVIHTRTHQLPGKRSFGPLRPRWRRWARSQGRLWGPRPDPDAPGARLVVVSVPQPLNQGRIGEARLHRDATRIAVEQLGGWAPTIHAHVGFLSGWATAEIAPTDTPMVTTEHYSRLNNILQNRRSRDLYAKCLYRTDRLLPVSNPLRDSIEAYFPDYAAKLQVVPNVVDMAGVKPKRHTVHHHDRWVCVGALIDRKRPQLVLESFAAYRETRPDSTLSFVGDGNLHGTLSEMIDRIGMHDCVSLLGPRQPAETIQIIRDNDVLVHLSHLETFGVVVAEAVGCGTAVVCTRSGGPEDILDDDLAPIGGAVLEVDCSPAEVAAAVSNLSSQHLDADAAASTARDRYSPATISQQLINIYDEVKG